MAPRSMSLDVLVRLKDMLSSPLRGLMNSLQGIGNMAKKIGVVGTAIAAISFMAPIKEAAAFQQKLVDIAGTANMSGTAAFMFVDELKTKYEGLALTIGQSSDTIASGAGQMIASGMDLKIIDQSIGGIGKAATAAHAEFSDMAGVATSLIQTLKLPADQLDGALAGLIVSGKEGAFEMKDMARYLPTLTGQMAKFGVTGREAVNFLGAALQIAKKGTSDPAEAANNLKNFLSKVMSPATVKNFKEAGVDIEAVMKNAAVKGINPIEAVVQKITKLTGTSGNEIAGLMKKAKAGGLEGADALANVREQLVKIHGAGKLGELFSDQQVMDFLIPMLGNIDEYKRIKAEVAKATGAVTDRDFETQMMALNQQLTIFGEIGTQATREVGLAFGEWLPAINANLEAALKWLRDFDTETGGMVRKSLMFAGAGILVAAALGTLGFVLPIVAAGLGAVAALISPVGALLALLAYGGMKVYQNWATIGPRLTAIWDETVSAAGEIAARFGPQISAGLSSAWTDIKGGLANLSSLFDGFKQGLDMNIDLSGLTIDNAKVVAFQALDVALQGIGAGWQAMKDFGEGFAPHLEGIGKGLGGTVNDIIKIGASLGDLAGSLAKLSGIDPSSVTNLVTGLFKTIGGLAGSSLESAANGIHFFADGLAKVAATAAGLANGSIDWSSLVPSGLKDLWSNVSADLDRFMSRMQGLPAEFAAAGERMGQGLYDGVVAKVDALVSWFKELPGRILSAIGSIDLSSVIHWPTLPTWLGGASPPTSPPGPSNDNKPGSASVTGYAPAAGYAPAQPGNQQVNVGGVIQVKVDGPGQVTGTTSANPSVPVTADTGRAVGRP